MGRSIMTQPDNITQFPGWEQPKANYCKVPNAFWQIDDLDPHQRIILLYILRHTWGFKEFDIHKTITIDEFQYGRKHKNGKRQDKGCGVSRGKISSSLSELEKKGYISVEIDNSDPARIKKSYMLKMQPIEDDSQNEPEVSNTSLDSVHVVNAEFIQGTQSSCGDNRTEKETKERNLRKNTSPASAEPDTKSESEAKDRDRLFDGIALLAFGLDAKSDSPDVKSLLKKSGGRIGKVKKYLTGLETPCTPDELWEFHKWYKNKYPDADLPRDDTKFAEHFTQFRVGVQQPKVLAAPYHKPFVPEPAPDISDEEREAMLKQLREARERVGA